MPRSTQTRFSALLAREALLQVHGSFAYRLADQEAEMLWGAERLLCAATADGIVEDYAELADVVDRAHELVARFAAESLDAISSKVGWLELFYRARCLLALQHHFRGEADRGVQILERAIREIEHWALAHHLLGLLLASRGRFQGARRELELALRYEPHDSARSRVEQAIDLLPR